MNDFIDPDDLYVKALRWIASRDDPTQGDVEYIAEYPSVALASELFGRSPQKIAERIASTRARKGFLIYADNEPGVNEKF